MNSSKGIPISQSLRFDIPVFLAPLSGYTNSPYRRVVKDFGAGLVFTEEVSVMGIKFGDKKTLQLLRFYESERPIFAQLFGNDPEVFAHSAKFVELLGFDGIDINAGCPVPKIVKGGSGASLLLNLPLLFKIAYSVKSAVKIPVSLKVRKGFYKGTNLLKDILKVAEDSGIDLLTIHGITAEEGFDINKEDWDAIAEVVCQSKIPVVANGGVKKEEDVKELFEKTKASYVMVGRASIGRPWFIKSSFEFLTKNTKISISNREKLDIIVRHIERAVEFFGEGGIVEMRKFLQAYAYGIRGAGEFRKRVNTMRTEEEAVALVRAFFDGTEA